MPEQRRIVVGVTGAGGTRLAGVLLNKLVDDERVGHVDVMVSANGRKLVAFEHGADENADAVALLLGRQSDEVWRDKVSVYDPEVDQAGPPSSGSYRFTDMIILPVRAGRRGADRARHGEHPAGAGRGRVPQGTPPAGPVHPRDPLNLIHLRNLVQLTEAGAVVYPMIPTYYNVPQNLKQMDEEFVLRLLGFIGLDQTDYFEWKDTERDTRAARPRRPGRPDRCRDRGSRRTGRAVRLIVGMTGATGAPLGVRLLEVLRDLDDVETHLVMSRWARTTIELETAYSVAGGREARGRRVRAGGPGRRDLVRVVPHRGHGHRAVQHEDPGGHPHGLRGRADRPRRGRVPEGAPPAGAGAPGDPLNDVHLENMLALSRMGATIFPPVPAFYNQPASLADAVDHLVVRILDQFGISAPGAKRWSGLDAHPLRRPAHLLTTTTLEESPCPWRSCPSGKAGRPRPSAR